MACFFRCINFITLAIASSHIARSCDTAPVRKEHNKQIKKGGEVEGRVDEEEGDRCDPTPPKKRKRRRRRRPAAASPSRAESTKTVTCLEHNHLANVAGVKGVPIVGTHELASTNKII